MLAYSIIQDLAKHWRHLDLTGSRGLRQSHPRGQRGGTDVSLSTAMRGRELS
jgi:hypothetical protein